MTGRRGTIIRRTYPSRMESVDDFCAEITQVMREHGLTDDIFAIELLAREAMTNAILHGNDCQEDKRVCLMFRIIKDMVVIRITDEGKGFTWLSMPCCAPDSAKASGRGLKIYSMYASRIAFSRRGNSVILTRRISGRKTDG